MTIVIVSLLGGLGAVARYLVSAAVDSRLSGRGTLVVNLAGSFVAGLLTGISMSLGVSHAASLGFLGGFTTFSTWVADALTGPIDRSVAGYVVMSLTLGLAAAICGMALTAL